MRHGKSCSGSKVIAALIAASFAVGGGCVDAPEKGHEQVQSRSESVQIVSSATCTVEWTKIDYKAPAGEEFIELRVTKSSELVETLGDCGLGGISLYQHADPCLVPYRSIPLQNISIQGQYVVVCQDQVNGVDCDVKINADDWLQDTATEIGFFSVSTGVNGSVVPMLWAQYATPDTDAHCIPPLTSPALHRVQDEAAATPTTGNAWCPPDGGSGAFVILNRADMEPRQSYTCPSGGAGGAGGTAGGGGTSSGGTAGAGGTSAGGTSAGGTAGAGGASPGGADSGGADSGGADSGGADSGGTDAGGADAGGADAGGADSGGADSGGADAGGADSGGADSGGADSGGTDSGGTDAGGAGSGNANAGRASGGTAGNGMGAASGSGATSAGGEGDGLSLGDIAIEGGGCTCSTAASDRGRDFGWLGLAAAMSVLTVRRRRTAGRRPAR